ncbi:3-hydroxyacyl-CoA dehydrogenase NAD-binding domain-containing protein [Neisseria sp. N177_16]|uniref:3-hydroxyacyl-CoA dehydrogenase NAD-binding domain-containing protein n=1 Tax=Neisseria TaxID=482 RepID=UPI0021010E0E
MKITVVGAGYVGLSNAVLFAQQHNVTLLDVNQERVDLINQKISPIQDDEISVYLAERTLTLHATTDASAVYADADYIVVAPPPTTIPKPTISIPARSNPC